MHARPDSAGVLIVDDNPYVADAMKMKLSRQPNMHWLGSFSSAEGLLVGVREHSPDIVILDIDMPGPDPFDVAHEISEQFPDVRVIFFSGHVRQELIDRAVQARAWGYISKTDGEDILLTTIQRVLNGEFVLSPEAEATYKR